MIVKALFSLALVIAAGAMAQDRLPKLPGYERYAKMRTEIGSSIERGTLRVTWIDDGAAFTFEKDGERVRYDTVTRKVGPYSPAAGAGGTGGAGPDPNARRPRPERGRQFTTAFSADGRMKAFARDRNLWVSSADGSDEVAVTTDGSVEKRIKNGMGSWVYGEELNQNDAMGWSPDGKALWFYRFDESKVPDYYLAMNVTKVQTTLDAEPYPKAGAPNPEVELFVYHLDNKRTTRVKVRPGSFDHGVGHYVYGIRWSLDGKELWFHRTSRKQDVMEWCAANPSTGEVRVIVREEWPASWTENSPRRVFLDEHADIGKAPQYKGKVLWTSERTGFKNLFLVDLAAGKTSAVTENPFEVASIVRVDLVGGKLWYMRRSGDNPYKLQLHRVGLDGKGDVRLTDPTLNHSVDLAPDGKHFIDVAEALGRPPETRLVDDNGKVVEVLKRSDTAKFDALGLKMPERIEFMAADGKTKLYGVLHRPSQIEPGEKLPLIVQVYGGPESGTDQERFQTPNPLTELGYCVAWFDGRGTNGRGKAFKDEIYGKLGVVEIDDQAAGVKHLVASQPFIDGARVGIEGTSYGGYASAMALLRHPDVFAAACAMSPVTDWKNYDTIYTERYMWIPQVNEKGYREGSAMTYVRNLRGRLLLYYGTADNNVHPANTYQLARALQQAGKSFDMQVGPDVGHSGMNQMRMMEFFHDWLKAPQR